MRPCNHLNANISPNNGKLESFTNEALSYWLCIIICLEYVIINKLYYTFDTHIYHFYNKY